MGIEKKLGLVHATWVGIGGAVLIAILGSFFSPQYDGASAGYLLTTAWFGVSVVTLITLLALGVAGVKWEEDFVFSAKVATAAAVGSSFPIKRGKVNLKGARRKRRAPSLFHYGVVPLSFA